MDICTFAVAAGHGPGRYARGWHAPRSSSDGVAGAMASIGGVHQTSLPPLLSVSRREKGSHRDTEKDKALHRSCTVRPPLPTSQWPVTALDRQLGRTHPIGERLEVRFDQ
jgi:hypothetical protein